MYGGVQIRKVYALYLKYDCTVTMVHLKTKSDLQLVYRNYATNSSIIIVLIC